MPNTDNAQFFALLTSHAMTINDTADRCAGSLRDCASRFEDLRKEVVDLAIARDGEATKRDLVSTIDDVSARCDLAGDAIRHGVLDAGEMANEIYAALSLRAEPLFHVTDLVDQERILRERANNIAAAYAGRVVREEK